MTHKFQVKRAKLGYITCCGTEIVKVTKDQDSEMWGSVNWYYQNYLEDIDSIPFYTLREIKDYLMKEHEKVGA